MKTNVLAAVVLLTASGLALSACEKQTKPPFETGVCFHVVTNKDGSLRYNPVARNVPTMEECAGTLEGMRQRFIRMGSPSRSMVGSYQGSFLFIEKEGILLGQTYEGPRYVSLVPTGDGRLAPPGAIRPAQ